MYELHGPISDRLRAGQPADGDRADDALRTVLSLTLSVAVPLRLFELEYTRRTRGDGAAGKVRDRWARDAADAVAHQGDALQFRGKPGTAEDVFNHLARGVAALSTLPGGVRFLGTLWCARHHPGGTAAPGSDPGGCPDCHPGDFGAYLTTEPDRALIDAIVKGNLL